MSILEHSKSKEVECQPSSLAGTVWNVEFSGINGTFVFTFDAKNRAKYTINGNSMDCYYIENVSTGQFILQILRGTVTQYVNEVISAQHSGGVGTGIYTGNTSFRTVSMQKTS